MTEGRCLPMATLMGGAQGLHLPPGAPLMGHIHLEARGHRSPWMKATQPGPGHREADKNGVLILG